MTGSAWRPRWSSGSVPRKPADRLRDPSAEAAQIPPQEGKWLLKKVAEKHIPLQNVNARKNGFQVSNTFTTGTEGLLRGGLLRDAMKWPAASRRRPDRAGKAGPAVAVAAGRHGAFPSPARRRSDNRRPHRSAARGGQGRSLRQTHEARLQWHGISRCQRRRGPALLSCCWTMIFFHEAFALCGVVLYFRKRADETAGIEAAVAGQIYDR